MDEDKKNIQARIYQRYQKDWVFMAEHGLRHGTWSKQREIIRAVQKYDRVAVQAAHGCSKTYTGAEIVVIFFNLFPNSRVITTAPIFDQVSKLLWKEIKQIYLETSIQLKGICYQGTNTCEIRDEKNHLHFAYGFSTDKPARAEGHHAYDILYVFDEAKGIPQWMWDSARGALGEGNAKWLVLSTTDGVDIGSPFYECFQPDSTWHQIKISSFDTPYYRGVGKFEGIKKGDLPNPKGEKFRKLFFPIENNITKFSYQYIEPVDYRAQINGDKYINQALADWGYDSYHWRTKVCGNIEDSSTDNAILLSQVKKMFDNYKDPNFDDRGPLRAGVDVSWGGDNKTVVYKAQGLKILAMPLVINTKGLPEEQMVDMQCNEIEKYLGIENKGKKITKVDGYEIRVDAASFGLAIAGKLKQRGWKVVSVNNARKSEKSRYDLIIDEIWLETAKYIGDIACPKINGLAAQLIQRKKIVNDKGQDKIEKKKDYIARGFESPDDADAFLLCVCNCLKYKAYHVSSFNPAKHIKGW